MAKYKVVDQPVEINGKTRPVGTILDESEFIKKLPNDKRNDPLDPMEDKSELESLLETGHVKKA